MKIKFWGTRGSFPTPHKDKMQYGGNTSCVEIITDSNEIIILDMGTGLIDLGNDLLSRENPPTDITILLSHYHWDHMIGFIGFTPLFDPRFNFKVYGKKDKLNLDSILDRVLHNTFWPVSRKMFQANLDANFFPNEGLTIGSTNIKAMLHGHPNGANSYRIDSSDRSVLYSTDCEHPVNHINPRLIEFGKDVDLIINDAQYTETELKDRIGWGHSSYDQSIELAKSISAKKLVLFHHDPMRNDIELRKIEKDAQKKHPDLVCAKEGMEIII